MVNLLTFFKDLGLRNKLLISYAFVFIVSIAIGGYISYKYAVSLIEKDVEDQLRKATRSITQLVKTAATVSTRNYLRGLVEKNIESLHYLRVPHSIKNSIKLQVVILQIYSDLFFQGGIS